MRYTAKPEIKPLLDNDMIESKQDTKFGQSLSVDKLVYAMIVLPHSAIHRERGMVQYHPLFRDIRGESGDRQG
jgi:hypothetical protein